MDTDISEAGKRKALEELSDHVRASLTAILMNAEALRDADDRNIERPERAALFDAIQRDVSHALDVVENALANEPMRSPEKRSKPRQAAYFGWLRSRLEQIEALGVAERNDMVKELSLQLKESAASMGYREVSEAGAAVARLSDTGGPAFEAALEILRRTVNRLVRRITTDAA